MASHVSFIHVANMSSCSKYSFVASLHRDRGFSPIFCHSRQPFDHHANIPGHSRLSFFTSLLSRLFNRDHHAERDQVEPTPVRLIDRPQPRFVVAGKDQFELWTIFKEVLAHEPRRHPVAAGQLLDTALRRLRPSSVSVAVTNLEPCRRANSVGRLSNLVAVNVSIDDVCA